jgi:activator of HSP90 ATPase
MVGLLKYYVDHILQLWFNATMNRQNWLSMTADAPTRRQLVARAVAFAGCDARPIPVWAGVEDGISHTAESIHQELVFQASRKRFYEALTDARQFDKIVQLSGAVQSGMAPGKRPTEISRQVGGAFTLFGGHTVGRHVELEPFQRIVQAWRVVDWNPGIYSIVKFELTEQGSNTKFIFDHTGFPVGKAQHLAEGWTANYWQPLRKYLVS